MAILVLETNVRVLKILQRALRVEEDGAGGRGETVTRVGRQAAEASRRTLGRLEDVLADLQESVRAEGDEDALPDLLEEAATLQDRVQTELERMEATAATDPTTGAAEAGSDAASVPIDVDAELESIRTQIDDENGETDG